MSATGHRPADHPVLERARFHADLAKAIDRNGSHIDPVAATVVSDTSIRIEELAQRVVLLPDVPLTPQQRRSLLIVAAELTRRANGPTLNERS